MKVVTDPELYLVAEPSVQTAGMLAYLADVGGEYWYERVFGSPDQIPEAEGLIEFMGRLCYRSWVPGLNKNVTKVREDRGEYLRNILQSGHGSVLEHAYFSFVIHNCSRVMTAELNRHRAGVAISEQSMRYVRLDDIPFRLPPTLYPTSRGEMEGAIMGLEVVIKKIIDREITDNMPFALKKEKTSAIRRLVPMGVATEEGWTANVRAIRHVISMRSSHGAEEEIRIFADQLAKLMQKKCPLLFGDYEEVVDTDGSTPEWTTPFSKV